uniref:Uncharacterized protein n=1 Tax=Bicosoecida sp. CB-2014 TaxID=1486930 RepID=A0A7S1CBA0_9STRA|mmetsp:Transcript_20260/g.71629  ORF Transcript_20260/g.71629 Transcript_20260/m.71629 type:complete len:190 (+) Transcript_20260:69-638(+)
MAVAVGDADASGRRAAWHRRRGARLGLLATAVLAVAACALPCAARADGVMTIAGDDGFEDTVLADRAVWLIGMVAGNERSAALESALTAVADELPGVAVGIVDIRTAKAVGSEFGVRKRKAPKLFAFLTRSRSAAEVALAEEAADVEGSAGAIAAAVRELLAQEGNEVVNGAYQKITLALGGAGGEQEL